MPNPGITTKLLAPFTCRTRDSSGKPKHQVADSVRVAAKVLVWAERPVSQPSQNREEDTEHSCQAVQQPFWFHLSGSQDSFLLFECSLLQVLSALLRSCGMMPKSPEVGTGECLNPSAESEDFLASASSTKGAETRQVPRPRINAGVATVKATWCFIRNE